MKKLFLVLLFCLSFSAFADTIYMNNPMGVHKKITNVSMVMESRPIYLIKNFLQNNMYVITESGILICNFNNEIYISSNYYITD